MLLRRGLFACLVLVAGCKGAVTQHAATGDPGGDDALPACDDGQHNGDETDVDCGGSCTPCPVGSACASQADCSTGVCVTQICLPETCDDELHNGDETDTDCGGSCAPCPPDRACATGADCLSGICAADACAAPVCDDGVANGSETDADCGGGCDPCADGLACSIDADCVSGVCDGLFCAAPTCADGAANGDESDVDCGGVCPACTDGATCSDPSDCQSELCLSHLCVDATCANNDLDPGETDVDCGGSCAPCADGDDCAVGDDCKSGICSDTCEPAACDDGVVNGDETDTDCGGSCPPCADGDVCEVGGDCSSLVCAGEVCRAPTCDDAVANGDETDTDCGGSCPACVTSESCAVAADCISGVCSGSVCQIATCSDGVRNGQETDTDCGGTCPSACPDGSDCLASADCLSGICIGFSCSTPACDDGVVNGDETDVDCGGACSPCGLGEGCGDDSDCQSAHCTTEICVDADCDNASQDGDETDVDCGGSCAPCADGDTCIADGDCQSTVCDSTCQPPACDDSHTNGDETDVDCGGACAACIDGAICATAADCQSGVCSGGTCAAPSCTDGVLNGDETDVDCGGSTCPGCLIGGDCLDDDDCAGGACLTGSCTEQLTILGVDPAAVYRGHPDDVILFVEVSGLTDPAGLYVYFTNGVPACQLDWDGTPPLPVAPVTCVSGDPNEIVAAYDDCSLTGTSCRVLADADGEPFALMALLHPNPDRPLGSYSVSVAATNGTFDTADDVLDMVATPPPTVTAVSPASAWSGSPDDGIVSDRAILIEGTSLLPVPQVVWVDINRSDRRFAAPYVEYLAPDMLSAVVPSESRQMPAALYHVRVVNPDGQSAYWIDGTARGLFEITTRPPPLIDDIDPLRIPKTEIATLAALLINGNNFADDFSSGAAARVFVVLPDDTRCELPVLPASSNGTQIAADAAGSGCPFDHYDYPLVVLNPDGQSATHYTFSVTEDSQGHLGTPQTVPHTLIEARGQHDGVAAYDDLGNGYVYVGGGIAPQSSNTDAVFAGSAQPVLSTVEVAQVSFTGELGQWRTLSQTDPAGFSGLASHELPRQGNAFASPRAGLQMARVGRFLYVIGGRDDAGAVLGTTERAELLGAGSATGIQFARVVGPSDPELAAGCSNTQLLAAGTYYYRVSAVTAAGEGLASRDVAVSLSAPGCVELQWEHVAATAGDATHPPRPAALYYVIYRTGSPDGSPQTERFLTWVQESAAGPCKRPNGLPTGVTACHNAFDTGEGPLAPAPGSLRPTDAAGTLTPGDFYAYRASVVAAGLELRSGAPRVFEVPATGGVEIIWDAIPDAEQTCLYRSLSGAADAGAAANEATFEIGCVPAGTMSFVDDGSGAPDPMAPAPEPAERLPRGSTTRWQVIDNGGSTPQPIGLRTPRWLHESITLHVSDPVSQDQTHFYIFTVGGLPASGVDVTAVASTERVEVSPLTGDFMPVPEYATPALYWDFERQDVSQPGDCDGGGANCLSMAWGRSLFALMTTQDRFATGDAAPGDPCAIPDQDGDGFNAVICGGADCDDLDSLRNPAAEPVCVDGTLLTTCEPCCPPPPLDADGDGFNTTEAGCCDPDVRLCDCDDSNDQRFPGAVEICGDGIDQDCDGLDEPCACTVGPWPPTSSDCTCCTDDPVIRAQYDPDGDGEFDAASPCCVPAAGCPCETACTPWPPTADDDGCCWVPETQVDHDRDGDGYFDPVSPCCTVTGLCDCDDFATGVNPGAVDICENGIDEDCDGSDPPCDNCDLDGDGYLSARVECGGSDCCDAGNEPSLGCDGTVAADDPHHPANINPGVQDAFLPPDCNDGIDNDCDGMDMPCLVGLTAQQADPDPIYLVAMSGSRGVDASGTELDNTDPVIEMVGIETTPARLGHMAWDDPCAAGDQGMTCMVGWEPDRVAPTGSGSGAAAINYGLEAVLYYDYIFRFGGTFSDTLFVDGSGGTYRNAVCLYSGCSSDPQPDGCHLTCPLDLADYDVNEHLIERSTQSVGDAVLTPRTMFALVRLFSRIISIGGLDLTGLPLDDVESIHQ